MCDLIFFKLYLNKINKQQILVINSIPCSFLILYHRFMANFKRAFHTQQLFRQYACGNWFNGPQWPEL